VEQVLFSQSAKASNGSASSDVGYWEAFNAEASSHPIVNGVPLGRLLRADLVKPKVLQICGDRDVENMRVSVGLAGQGSPMLPGRNASWSVLLFGKKKWFLVSPGVNASVPGLLTKASPHSLQPTIQWLREHAPSLRSRGLLSEVTQLPGEVIFVPHGWHFATLNLLASGDISQEFCTLRHTDMRVQPLGSIVYGSNDSTRAFGRTKYHYQRLHFATLGDEKRSKFPNFGFDL
jgi:hypothetical protein